MSSFSINVTLYHFEHKKIIQSFDWMMVEEGGFEPPKSVTTDLQSAPFGRSGTPPYEIGAGGRIRTPDLLITNQLLYRLSYTSKYISNSRIYLSRQTCFCQHPFLSFFKEALILNHFQHRSVQHPRLYPRLYCTMCGQEITMGEEYWACNGNLVCTDCLPELARQELAPCHETRGKERPL